MVVEWIWPECLIFRNSLLTMGAWIRDLLEISLPGVIIEKGRRGFGNALTVYCAIFRRIIFFLVSLFIIWTGLLLTILPYGLISQTCNKRVNDHSFFRECGSIAFLSERCGSKRLELSSAWLGSARHRKLKHLKFELKKWNWQMFGNINTQMIETTLVIQDLELKLQHSWD